MGLNGWTQERKDKARARLLGGHLKESTRQKISATHRGKSFSEEHRKNLRLSHLGYVPSEEHRNNLSWALRGRVFSIKTLAKRSGKNHWAWKGGISRWQDRITTSPEYKKWREIIFKRDDYTCQVCGKRGCYLEPHHIMRKADYPEYAYEPENGLTLCHDCHRYSILPITKCLVYPEIGQEI